MRSGFGRFCVSSNNPSWEVQPRTEKQCVQVKRSDEEMNTNELNYDVALEIVRASDIEPKEVKWLWYPYIPFGKVTLLQGNPGGGKSKLMLSIAALLSKGEPLPFSDEEEREPITTIYQTTEDDADDTVVP